MKVKISDRESEAKMARWKNGEVGVFSKERVNCEVNDVDDCLLRKRAENMECEIEYELKNEEDFMLIWGIIYN